MKTKRRLTDRLAFRIIVPVFFLVIILGTVLYLFVLRSITEFQENIVARDMDWTSKSIFNILDDNIYKLMITGSLGNKVLEQIQKGKAIGEIEDFIRQRELNALIFSETAKKLIFSSGFSDVYFAQIEKNFIENTTFRTTYGGTGYIGYHIDFDPWKWHIVLLKDKAGYSSLMLQVRNANAATAVILLLSALLLSIYLRSYIKKPVEEIIEPLAEGRTPEYRGIHEFEFISDNIRSMMDSLKESERRYRLLADNVTDVIWTLDMDMNRTYLSPSVIRLRGFSVGELIEMPLSESMTEESFNTVRSVFTQEMDLEGKSGQDPFRSRTLELEFLCKDGSSIWGEVKTSFLRDETGQAIGILGVTRDITERMKAREALRDSEERYRQMFERNPLPMMIIDIESLEFLNVNTAAVELYGYTRNEFLNMTIKDIRPTEDVEAVVDYVSRLEPGIDHQGIWRHKKKDGDIIYVDITSHDMVYGGLRARVGLCNDVTEQLTAQRALSESEERYRTLVEKGMVGVYLIQDGLFVYVNDKLAEIFGYTSDELVDKKGPENLVLPEDWPIVKENIRLRIDGEVDSVNYDFKGIRKDGTAIQVEVHGSAIEYHGKLAVLGTLLDITERMRSEKALRESEERFRTAFRTSPDAMCINTYKTGEFIEINDGFLNLTGYKMEEVIGKSIFDLGIWQDDKDRQRLVDGMKATGQVSSMETGFRLKDGNVIPCLYSAKSFSLEDETYILSIVSDITDLKSAEDKIKASLLEKEILLKEIHHRVKNNLQVISGLLNLQSHYINEEGAREIYRESQNRIITMALIHEELYQREDLSSIDFADFLQTLSDNLLSSYGMDKRRISIELDIKDAELIIDTAIPCGLIINELVSNSLKHAFPGKNKGEISVKLHSTGNKGYSLKVSDNGTGFPKGVNFRQTKSLGLQLVTVLVDQLGGTIKMVKRKGTTFYITFKEYREAGTELH